MKDIIFCQNGGCSAKLGAGVLKKVLEKLPKNRDSNLLVGFDSNDDGAVYQINETQAIVSTLDFFPPLVEDPYLYGAIAAANAMSDIYAMGGEVKTALNIVCFPPDMDLNILGKIMQGGNDKVKEANATLAGGHSIVDDSIKYGLSVTGLVSVDRIYRNNTCQCHDVLILTKKLGVGIILSAHRIKEASQKAYEEAIASMTTLNRYAAEILKKYEVHACSDVTGFGFLVHLIEMLDNKFSAIIDSQKIPYFEECESYVEEFYLTAAAQKNRNHVQQQVYFEKENFVMEEILYDPQTSGGLLVSVKAKEAEAIINEMHAKNIPAQIVGEIIPKHPYAVIVK